MHGEISKKRKVRLLSVKHSLEMKGRGDRGSFKKECPQNNMPVQGINEYFLALAPGY